MSHHRFSTLIITLVLFAGMLCSPALAATPEQVDDAIAKGVKYLYTQQQADGTWEIAGGAPVGQEGGQTAMTVYALVSAGESPNDPRIVKAMQALLKIDVTGTYAMGFEALALEKMNLTPDMKTAVLKLCKRLILGCERNTAPMGLFTYQYNTLTAAWDHSCSQYGALGIWACADMGVEIPDRVWQEIDSIWRKQQMDDGGWGYNFSPENPGPSKDSMTAAGIATLFITADALSWQKMGDCSGNVVDANIDKGIKWMIPHLTEGHDLYTWYGIERIGMACGYKYLGTFDWYREGASVIVANQEANGSWPAQWGGVNGSTVYALLFLSRGRAPVLMNKLHYYKDSSGPDAVDGTWNQRPRDVAGAARFVGRQLESFLNWQVVTTETDPDDWHDAPILYISGYDALKFTPEQEAKLRRFIEDGGMILGNADCAAPGFSDSFRALFVKLFDHRYEFRPLPADHLLFTHQQFNKWKSRPLVEGMSNGVREIALLIPKSDPAKAWQMQETRSRRDSFELMADVYLYATDRQGQNEKGVTTIVKPDTSITAKATVKLAHIQYKGNWDPEPGGWRRLAAMLHNGNAIDLTVTPVTADTGTLTGFAVAHLTGTTAFEFTSDQRAEIKKFVTGGGKLIVEAAGGSKPFVEAAQKELNLIFGADAQQLAPPLPIDDAIFGDLKTDDFKYRAICRVSSSPPHGSRICGIKFNGHIGVIFSQDDLSAGLVGENVDGVYGFTPEAAVRLMSQFIVGAPPKAGKTPPIGPKTLVFRPNWQGTGFLITDDGLILTNRHVAADAKEIHVLIGGKEVPAKVVVIDDEQDLALIRIDMKEKTPFLHLIKADVPKEGSDCVVMGFPMASELGEDIKITRGIISGIRDQDKIDPDLLTDAKVNPGNSGGPIVDRNGNVMGIVSMKSFNSEEIDSYGIGMSAGHIRKFLSKNNVTLTPGEDSATPLATEDIAALVKPATVCILVMQDPSKPHGHDMPGHR